MKKVALFLVLVSSIGGMAQAQTPQVRLVWEKTIPEGAFQLALDEQDTLSPPAVTFLTPQSNERSQKILRIDSTGMTHDILAKRPNDPVVLSPNGRFIGINRWMYDPDFRNLPTPYVITPSGGRATLQGECGECEIAAISNDGRVILGTKGIGYPLEVGRVSTKRETLIFYNGQGQVVREVPANWENGKKLSSDGSYLVIRQRLLPEETDPGAMVLKLYDSQGRKLWEKERAVGFKGNLDVSESGVVADGYYRVSDSTSGVRFFNRSGDLLGDVNFGKQTHALAVHLDAEARYALVHCRRFLGPIWKSPLGETIILLRVNPSSIVWRRDLPAQEQVGRSYSSFERIAIAREGKIVAASVWGPRTHISYGLICDFGNREIWRYDMQGGKGLIYVAPSGKYFLMQTSTLKLYKIEQ